MKTKIVIIKTTKNLIEIRSYYSRNSETHKCLYYLHENGCPSDINYADSEDELEFYGTTPYWPVSRSPLKVSRKKRWVLSPGDKPFFDLVWDVVYDPNNPS
jgi:hypothetical protein